jgi:hypothetical protein
MRLFLVLPHRDSRRSYKPATPGATITALRMNACAAFLSRSASLHSPLANHQSYARVCRCESQNSFRTSCIQIHQIERMPSKGSRRLTFDRSPRATQGAVDETG